MPVMVEVVCQQCPAQMNTHDVKAEQVNWQKKITSYEPVSTLFSSSAALNSSNNLPASQRSTPYRQQSDSNVKK